MLIQLQPTFDFWPVRIRRRQGFSGMGGKIVGVRFVIDQIELAVDYFERVRIDVDRDRAAHDLGGAIAALLGRIFYRVGRKHLLVFAAGEVPRRAEPII
jgi:hypothetical protein